MITHPRYMPRSRKLDHAYYLEVAQEAGVRIPDFLLDRAKDSNFPYFDDVLVQYWDACASPYQSPIRKALEARGDAWSPGAGVLCLKALAKHIIRVEHDTS